LQNSCKFLYDSRCGLCVILVNFVVKKIYDFASLLSWWQSPSISVIMVHVVTTCRFHFYCQLNRGLLMCQRCFRFVLFFPLFFLTSFVIAAEDTVTWDATNGRPWSRKSETLTVSKADLPNDGSQIVTAIRHTATDADWALSSGQRIAVKPGDVFELSATIKLAGTGHAGTSVVLYDAKGEVIRWSWSSRDARDTNGQWVTLQSQFTVPRGTTTLEPRLVGYGEATIECHSLALRHVGKADWKFSDLDKPLVLENTMLHVAFDATSGTMAVTDKRINRQWEQSPQASNMLTADAKIVNINGSKAITCRLIDQEYMQTPVDVEFRLVGSSPELLVTIEGHGEMGNRLAFPAPFVSRPGERLIVPMNEGIGFPVDDRSVPTQHLITYGGHGICMGFWGQVEDATGIGHIAIIETSDDGMIMMERGKNEMLQITSGWEPSMGEFRYPRKLRYVFFDGGGYVAVCKRYRQHAKDTGLWVPFAEKVKRNPNIDLLIGAANIWTWDRGKVAIVKELKEAGIDRILWSGGGSAEELTEMNAMPNVLTSRYDIYQDIMDPSRFGELRSVHGDWVTEAWPHDINRLADGTWRKGWEVTAKDPTQSRIPCAVICDSKAIPYAKKRIGNELKTKSYRARFIDTTVAAPWFECYDPDHPMTRSDSRNYKMQLLDLMGTEFGLVCGSETGHEASVPFCDFYEGMMSLGPYRVPDSGRDMSRIWDEVPERVEKFQVGETYRLPLWELVYHDCTVSYWYWGDYNNKLPTIWRKRDLFNALYGVPPMYMFNQQYWREHKQQFVESYKIAAPVSRLTGYSEMTDHRVLTDDRTVQQTQFANGVRVTVNFGERAFKMSDGHTLEPLGHRIETNISK